MKELAVSENVRAFEVLKILKTLGHRVITIDGGPNGASSTLIIVKENTEYILPCRYDE